MCSLQIIKQDLRGLKMKKLFFTVLLPIVLAAVNTLSGQTWDRIHLPHEYVVPRAVLSRNVYSTQLPGTPLVWVKSTECGNFQPTSIHWKSDLIANSKGISFKGLVFKQPEFRDQGNPLNSFAVFFHENQCYVDGSEYGWNFKESKLPRAEFYVCSNCNISGDQKWASWPGSPSALKVLEGDPTAVELALEDSAIYRYWNIKLTTEGNFYIELVNPSTYDKVWVTLQKPSWFPNLYNSPGFVTITAKRQAEEILSPAPYMHIDDVKVWQ